MPDGKDEGGTQHILKPQLFKCFYWASLFWVITRLAKPNSLGFYGKYAYFYKTVVSNLTHIWLCLLPKKKKRIAAVGTFPHLSQVKGLVGEDRAQDSLDRL